MDAIKVSSFNAKVDFTSDENSPSYQPSFQFLFTIDSPDDNWRKQDHIYIFRHAIARQSMPSGVCLNASLNVNLKIKGFARQQDSRIMMQ